MIPLGVDNDENVNSKPCYSSAVHNHEEVVLSTRLFGLRRHSEISPGVSLLPHVRAALTPRQQRNRHTLSQAHPRTD